MPVPAFFLVILYQFFNIASRVFQNPIDFAKKNEYNTLMNAEMKRHIAESIRGFRLPRYREIPTVGLYLEQTIKYINGYLAPLGCQELTSSMVSNYVKKGLVPAPIKKQYYPEQITYLFFVALAKNLVSMEDIALLIEVQQSSYTLPTAYDYLCAEMENVLYFNFGLKDTMDILGSTESDEKDLMRNLIYSAANVIYMNACFRELRAAKNDE